jgi:hypothetical protein
MKCNLNGFVVALNIVFSQTCAIFMYERTAVVEEQSLTNEDHQKTPQSFCSSATIHYLKSTGSGFFLS